LKEQSKEQSKQLETTRGAGAIIIRRPLEIVANLIGFICCVLEIYDKAGPHGCHEQLFIRWQIAESPRMGYPDWGLCPPRQDKWAGDRNTF